MDKTPIKVYKDADSEIIRTPRSNFKNKLNLTSSNLPLSPKNINTSFSFKPKKIQIPDIFSPITDKKNFASRSKQLQKENDENIDINSSVTSAVTSTPIVPRKNKVYNYMFVESPRIRKEFKDPLMLSEKKNLPKQIVLNENKVPSQTKSKQVPSCCEETKSKTLNKHCNKKLQHKIDKSKNNSDALSSSFEDLRARFEKIKESASKAVEKSMYDKTKGGTFTINQHSKRVYDKNDYKDLRMFEISLDIKPPLIPNNEPMTHLNISKSSVGNKISLADTNVNLPSLDSKVYYTALQERFPNTNTSDVRNSIPVRQELFEHSNLKERIRLDDLSGIQNISNFSSVTDSIHMANKNQNQSSLSKSKFISKIPKFNFGRNVKSSESDVLIREEDVDRVAFRLSLGPINKTNESAIKQISKSEPKRYSRKKSRCEINNKNTYFKPTNMQLHYDQCTQISNKHAIYHDNAEKKKQTFLKNQNYDPKLHKSEAISSKPNDSKLQSIKICPQKNKASNGKSLLYSKDKTDVSSLCTTVDKGTKKGLPNSNARYPKNKAITIFNDKKLDTSPREKPLLQSPNTKSNKSCDMSPKQMKPNRKVLTGSPRTLPLSFHTRKSTLHKSISDITSKFTLSKIKKSYSLVHLKSDDENAQDLKHFGKFSKVFSCANSLSFSEKESLPASTINKSIKSSRLIALNGIGDNAINNSEAKNGSKISQIQEKLFESFQNRNAEKTQQTKLKSPKTKEIITTNNYQNEEQKENVSIFSNNSLNEIQVVKRCKSETEIIVKHHNYFTSQSSQCRKSTENNLVETIRSRENLTDQKENLNVVQSVGLVENDIKKLLKIHEKIKSDVSYIRHHSFSNVLDKEDLLSCKSSEEPSTSTDDLLSCDDRLSGESEKIGENVSRNHYQKRTNQNFVKKSPSTSSCKSKKCLHCASCPNLRSHNNSEDIRQSLEKLEINTKNFIESRLDNVESRINNFEQKLAAIESTTSDIKDILLSSLGKLKDTSPSAAAPPPPPPPPPPPTLPIHDLSNVSFRSTSLFFDSPCTPRTERRKSTPSDRSLRPAITVDDLRSVTLRKVSKERKSESFTLKIRKY